MPVACQGCHVSVVGLFSVLETGHIVIGLVLLAKIKCQALTLVPNNIRWSFGLFISDNQESAWADFFLVDHIDFLSFRSPGTIFKHLDRERQYIVFFVDADPEWS